MNIIKLILLEDDPADVMLIKEMLAKSKDLSFEIEHFDRLENVLKRLSVGGCDIVLTDLNLPDSKGLETFLAIHRQVPSLPVIVLTGMHSEDMGIRAIQQGAQDYLLKNDITSSLLCRSMVYATERKKKEEIQKKRYDSFSRAMKKDETINVLMLEDDPADVILIQEMLASAKGFRFKTDAYNKLSDGLKRLSETRYDLVLTDLHVLDSKGLETFISLYQDFPRIPIVVLTGSENEEAGIKSVAEGAQDYLLKQEITPYILTRSIIYAIERKGVEEELRMEEDDLKSTINELKLKNKELKEIQNRLIESEKIATIAKVAAAAAHETRNPLAVIKSSTYYLNLLIGELIPEARNKLSQIDDAVNRATLYITHLLDFAMPITPDMKQVEVNGLIEESLREIPHEMLAGIEIDTDFASNLPVIKADSQLMKQVFYHLVRNAVEAMGEVKSEKLKVKSEREEVGGRQEAGDRKEGRGEEAGDFVKITIKDTGKGIPEQDLLHIFDPFFTTKAKETGLGLAICQQIMNAHQGGIEVKSEIGKWTEVVIRMKAECPEGEKRGK